MLQKIRSTILILNVRRIRLTLVYKYQITAKFYRKRHATAVWNGTIKEGKGNITTQITVLDHTQYSFSSRFEDERNKS